MDVSLTVPAGKIVTVLGANGAGKSSLLRTISGLLRKAEGSIEFGEQTVMRRGMGLSRMSIHMRADQIVRAGIVHVPEGRQVFGELTVEENLMLGGYTRSARQCRGSLLDAYELFPGLRIKRSHQAASLSGGEQQMLAIGRALMALPTLLMLDEPSVGLAPKIVREVLKSVASLREKLGCTVLLVEQNAEAALEISDYGYVLEAPGHVVAEGIPTYLRETGVVRQAYLGR